MFILIRIRLKLYTVSQNNYQSALVQFMDWHQTGDKPLLPEPAKFTDAHNTTKFQWVNKG